MKRALVLVTGVAWVLAGSPACQDTSNTRTNKASDGGSTAGADAADGTVAVDTPEADPGPALCVVSCAGKSCGDDGCGGVCGLCSSGWQCTQGKCKATCEPTCSGKSCGEDGCGGSCGSCSAGTSCQSGTCVADCAPACGGKKCGSDGCGGSCGSCLAGTSCQSGACVADCAPACGGKKCGSDGCGGSCGNCPAGQVCDAGGQCAAQPSGCGDVTFEGCCDGDMVVFCEDDATQKLDCKAGPCGWNATSSFYDCNTDGGAEPSGTHPKACDGSCAPSCAGKECGDDGCGGSCGDCAAESTCESGVCVSTTCVPFCVATWECGPDGCGGSCGVCAAGSACDAWKCVAVCTDADSDGYGNGCAAGPDCDDGAADVHPGAPEICGNELDEDCDGADAPCCTSKAGTTCGSDGNLHWTDSCGQIGEVALACAPLPNGAGGCAQCASSLGCLLPGEKVWCADGKLVMGPNKSCQYAGGLVSTASVPWVLLEDCGEIGCDPVGKKCGAPVGGVDVVFPGGYLDDLKAYSPTLVFGDLTLTGTLHLRPSDGPVQLNVENLTATGSGMKIDVEWSACNWDKAPSLTIVASGTVSLENASVDGKWGKGTTTSTTCNQCEGGDAGNLTIVAGQVNLYGFISAHGGAGSTFKTQGLTVGCSGGHAGALLITASSTKLGPTTVMDVTGGKGGPSGGGQPSGATGKTGTVDIPNGYEADEHEKNGLFYSPGYASLPLRSATIHGAVSTLDDADTKTSTSKNKVFINYENGTSDFIEDLYSLVAPAGAGGQATFAVTASNGAADLDFFLLTSDGKTILAQSNSPGSNESFSYSVQGGVAYLLGVSLADDNGKATDYTVTVSK